MPEPTIRAEHWLSMDDGASLRVLEFGEPSAPPLIFVAGWLSLPRGWTEVIAEVCRDYRLFYLETREKASSRLRAEHAADFSVERLRLDLVNAVAALVPAGQHFRMAGSSLGATVILEYLAAGCRPPDSAVLIAPNREYRYPAWFRIALPYLPVAIYPVLREVIKFYLRRFRLDPQQDPEQYAKYAATLDCADPHKLKPNAISLMHYQLPALGNVNTPILILGGAADKLHGLDDLRWMAEQMPQARLLPMASNKATHSAQAGMTMRRFFAQGFSQLTPQLDEAQR